MEREERKIASIFKKGEEFLGLYQKVENFTRELLQENEKLRYKVAALDQENKNIKNKISGTKQETLVEQIKRLETEKEELLNRYKKVEQENVDFANRYVEIEAENNNLANLYVASYQLHSTLEFGEVLQIVKEIIINLIGAECFAVFLMDPKKRILSPVVSESIDEAKMPEVKFGKGIIGKSILEDHGVYVAPEKTESNPYTSVPLVTIPLRIKKEAIGVIAIFQLFEQKKEFTPLDIELFNLLGGHAATAIFGSKLFSESKRKLSTIEGFLELLKPQ